MKDWAVTGTNSLFSDSISREFNYKSNDSQNDPSFIRKFLLLEPIQPAQQMGSLLSVPILFFFLDGWVKSDSIKLKTVETLLKKWIYEPYTININIVTLANCETC